MWITEEVEYPLPYRSCMNLKDLILPFVWHYDTIFDKLIHQFKVTVTQTTFVITYWGELGGSSITCILKLLLILEGNLSCTLGNACNEIEKGIDLLLIK